MTGNEMLDTVEEYIFLGPQLKHKWEREWEWGGVECFC